MFTIDEYKFLVGETILHYQLIENDLKIIYAGMLMGNIEENLAKVDREFRGLGDVIFALEKLDNSDGHPFFSENDYRMLKRLAGQRNYYCHQCFVDFCYIRDFIRSEEYAKSCSKLKRTNDDIKKIQEQTENFKLTILNQYNRR